MMLSSHFSLREAIKSQTARRHGVDNSPDNPEVVANLRHVAERILEPVRAHFGVPVCPSSWYRCAELNRRVGGSGVSQHIAGEAVDFEVAGVTNLALAEWVAAELPFDQIVLECFDPGAGDPNDGWVHVSLVRRPGRNRGAMLVYDGRRYLPWPGRAR